MAWFPIDTPFTLILWWIECDKPSGSQLSSLQINKVYHGIAHDEPQIVELVLLGHIHFCNPTWPTCNMANLRYLIPVNHKSSVNYFNLVIISTNFWKDFSIKLYTQVFDNFPRSWSKGQASEVCRPSDRYGAWATAPGTGAAGYSSRQRNPPRRTTREPTARKGPGNGIWRDLCLIHG